MSIIEGIHQYQNNTASNTQILTTVKDTLQPVSSGLQEMTPGRVFEGVILEIKNGQVTIGLNDGQTLTARMESSVQLEEGMPVLFEVKANSGEQISLRPVNWESAQNPTLLKALKAAGLKVTAQNLSMVSEMMKEQLPVDKASLQQMARLMAHFPKAEVQTLLQLQKAGIEINESTIEQFENYRNNQQSFLPEMKEIINGLPQMAEEIYGGGQSSANPAPVLQFQQQIAAILTGGQTGADGSAQTAVQAAQSAQAAAGVMQNAMVENLSVSKVDAAEGVTIHKDLTQQESGDGVRDGVGGRMSGDSGFSNTLGNGENPAGQQANFTVLLQEFSGAVENKVLFQNGQLNPELTAGELLQQIVASVENSENYTGAAMQKLFFSDEYKEVLTRAMEEQWLATLENLKEEGTVKELYQRMGRQMEQLQQVLTRTGTEAGAALAKSARGVQSNLEFMNQLNQMYTYVQIPLKLQNQQVHSDLYVYTNKKNLREKEGELTALLHLDMEHLGATDIYIKLQGNTVDTKFYLGDSSSYDIILKNIASLQERLEAKGYGCRIEVENRAKEQDFVEEFLENEKPFGKFQRYSFDVKA